MDISAKDLLLSDEKILWEGKPNRKIFTARDWFNVPTGILGFAMILIIRFVVISSFEMQVPLLFDIMYSIVTLSIFYQVFGRFLFKLYVQSRTKFYVTNLRVLVIRNLRKQRVDEEKIKEIRGIDKKIKYNGKSKVVFGNRLPFYSNQENTYIMPTFSRKTRLGNLPLGFYDLDDRDAEKVCDIVSGVI